MRGWIFPIVLIAVAQAAAMAFGIASDNLAAPSDIAVAAWMALIDGSLLRASAETLLAGAGGLALGGLLGLAVGAAVGLSRPTAHLLQVPIETVRPVPSVALLPVALLVFGFGFRMEIAIIAFACFWPILIMTQSAVGEVEPQLIEVGRVLGLRMASRLRKIILPAALPRLFVGVRLATGIALVVAVTTEITINPMGLGYGLISAQQSINPALMFALLVWIGVLGWLVNALMVLAQKHLFGPAGLA